MSDDSDFEFESRSGGNLDVVASSQRPILRARMQHRTSHSVGSPSDQFGRKNLILGVVIVLLGVFVAAYVSFTVKSIGDNAEHIVVEAARWNLACWAIGKNCHYRNDSSGDKLDDLEPANLTQVVRALKEQAESSNTLVGTIQDVAGVASIGRVRSQAFDLMILADKIGGGSDVPNRKTISRHLRGIGHDVASLSSNLGQMNVQTYDALRSFSQDYAHVLHQLETLLENPSRAGWNSFTLRTKNFVLDFLWDIGELQNLTSICADLAERTLSGQEEISEVLSEIPRIMDKQVEGLSPWDWVWHQYVSYEGKRHREDHKLISYGWERVSQMQEEMLVIRDDLDVVKRSTTGLLRKIEQRWSSEMREVENGRELASHLAGFKAMVNGMHQRVNASEGWISA